MAEVPDFIVERIIVTDYLGGKASGAGAKGDRFVRGVGGPDDDLQSAGITDEQFIRGNRPGVAAAPIAAEIRRLAIFNDYSGLIDTSKAGGLGVISGPSRKGLVHGREYLAFARLPNGGPVFTVMAQIPADFDRQQPMIMTAPSSGSRGIYGAISMAEWAFLNKCAIAYTDKGTSPGMHDLDSGGVYGLDGLRINSSDPQEATFKVPDSPDLDAYKRALPHRLAVKHAHSQANIEAHWGQYVLYSIRFCLFCLNDWLGDGGTPFERPRTKVIAAGVSNGGGAALRAAEQDLAGAPLIDGVVVSEPQVQPRPILNSSQAFAIRYDGRTLSDHSRSFMDTITFMDMYAPCAAFAIDTSDPSSPVQQRRVRHGLHLTAHGLLKGSNPGEQAREALALVHQYGVLPEADLLLPVLDWLGMWRLLATVFANAHAKTSITDHLCGQSIAPVDAHGLPKALPPTIAAQLCGWGNGLGYSILGVGNTNVIDDQAATPASAGAALCFRSLVTGVPYRGQNAVEAPGVDAPSMMATGIDAVRANGNLRGKPAIILHGRSDPLLPPNHTSRAYYGLNKTVEGAASKLSYVEVVNGNHFDSFIPLLGPFFPMFGPNTLIPMHYYFEQALTRMRDHLLSNGAKALPPSQVVVGATAHKPWNTLRKAQADMPDFEDNPPASSSITFDSKVLNVPKG